MGAIRDAADGELLDVFVKAIDVAREQRGIEHPPNHKCWDFDIYRTRGAK